MYVRLLVASEMSVLDQRSNGLSLISIIEEMSSPAFPFIIPRFSIATLYEREASDPEKYDDFTISAHLGDQELFSFAVPVDFQGKLRLRNITDVGGLVITVPGILRVVLYKSGNPYEDWEIPITKIGGPEPKVTTAPADTAPKDTAQPI